MKNFLHRFFLLFILTTVFLFGQEKINYSSDYFDIEVEGIKLKVRQNQEELITVNSINFNFQQPVSIKKLSETDSSLILELIYPSVAKYRETGDDLPVKLEIITKDNSIRFISSPEWASNITIKLKDDNGHYFGILEPLYPENLKSPDLRGQVVDVQLIGNAGLYLENYATVYSAFFMTNKGYASFFDSFAEGEYSLGINGETELFHHTGKLDWYIFTGKNGDEIMKSYYDVIGKPKYVPMWACGPIGWRDENKGGKDEILDDVRKMSDLGIPFTAWFVDRPYSDGNHGWSKMNFNEKFSEPEKWIAELNNKYGLQFMSWVAPQTFGDTAFPGLFPNYKYYFDLTDPEVIKEYSNRLKNNLYDVNVRGHKMDRADEDFSPTFLWYDETPGTERRAKFVYLYSKVIDQFLTESFGKDQVNFARAAYHRCQPYLSAVWGGDSRGSWNGLAGNLANAMRVSYMGFPVWGSDVGGYFGGRIPEELYARWLQFGAWSGLFEIKLDNAGGQGEDRPPWKYSEQLQKIFKKYCDQRMEFQPYIYSLANSSDKNGVAMKPMTYAYPDDQDTYDLWDQYLFGDAFLVAPVLNTSSKREVYLPEGEWYDYNNFDKKYTGKQTISVTVPLENIPVFIKANSIWVTGKLLDGNSALWDKTEKNITIHYLPSLSPAECVFNFVDYLDSDREKEIKVISGENEIILESPSLIIDSKVEIILDSEPLEVSLNGNVYDKDWDSQNKILKVNLKKDQENKIRIII